MTDQDVIDTMLAIGGNFIRHIARAYLAADPVNQARLRAAYAAEWQEYGNPPRCESHGWRSEAWLTR